MKTSPHGEVKTENYHQINAKICRLVEKFPCMYDRSHLHYLRKDVVDKAWSKIAKEIDDSVPSCKERWRNIRTSFARSINVNKVPASANRTKPYYLHEELQFLARHITPGIPISRRLNAYSSAGEESEVIEVSVGEDTFDGFALAHDDDDSQGANEAGSYSEPNDDDIKNEQYDAALDEVTNTVAAANAAAAAAAALTAANCPSLKKRKRHDDSDGDGGGGGILDCAEQKYSEQHHDGDLDAIFLQGLLPEMKAMDFRQKIYFKRRIYEVIGDIFEHPLPPVRQTAAVSATASASATATAASSAAAAAAVAHLASPLAAAAACYGGQVKLPPLNSCSPTALCAPVTPTMTVVNAADLAVIRRLNSLLQSPQVSCPTATATTATAAAAAATAAAAIVAAPKSVYGAAAMVPQVRTAGVGTATVAVNRNALPRSTANLLRVTMVNAPSAMAAVTASATQQVVKQEPDLPDDD